MSHSSLSYFRLWTEDNRYRYYCAGHIASSMDQLVFDNSQMGRSGIAKAVADHRAALTQPTYHFATTMQSLTDRHIDAERAAYVHFTKAFGEFVSALEPSPGRVTIEADDLGGTQNVELKSLLQVLPAVFSKDRHGTTQFLTTVKLGTVNVGSTELEPSFSTFDNGYEDGATTYFEIRKEIPGSGRAQAKRRYEAWMSKNASYWTLVKTADTLNTPKQVINNITAYPDLLVSCTTQMFALEFVYEVLKAMANVTALWLDAVDDDNWRTSMNAAIAREVRSASATCFDFFKDVRNDKSVRQSILKTRLSMLCITGLTLAVGAMLGPLTIGASFVIESAIGAVGVGQIAANWIKENKIDSKIIVDQFHTTAKEYRVIRSYVDNMDDVLLFLAAQYRPAAVGGSRNNQRGWPWACASLVTIAVMSAMN